MPSSRRRLETFLNTPQCTGQPSIIRNCLIQNANSDRLRNPDEEGVINVALFHPEGVFLKWGITRNTYTMEVLFI